MTGFAKDAKRVRELEIEARAYGSFDEADTLRQFGDVFERRGSKLEVKIIWGLRNCLLWGAT